MELLPLLVQEGLQLLESGDRYPVRESPMAVAKYMRRIRTKAALLGLRFEQRGTLKYSKPFPFVRITSRGIAPGDKILLVRAGVHGEEVAGPLSILHHLRQIKSLADWHGVKLVIYPMANPSGFEAGHRWNERRIIGNGDDWLRYRNDKTGEYEYNDKADVGQKWKDTSEVNPEAALSQEVQAFRKEIASLPMKQVRGVLDLHQDYWMPKKNRAPAYYCYVHGPKTPYTPIIAELKRILPPLVDTISTGFTQPDESDKNGIVLRYDGGLPDYCWRHGVPYCIVSETTGSTPLDKAEKINLVWIKGLLELISGKKTP
jgi:hypothetical protein